MVDCRGGLNALSPSIQSKVCMSVIFVQLLVITDEWHRADMVGCIKSDMTPRYPFFGEFDDTAPQAIPEPPKSRLGNSFKSLLQNFKFDIILSETIHDLQSLSDLYIEHNAYGSPDLQQLEHFAAMLRHRLLSCPSARMTTTPRELIMESCRIGALIHLKTILPEHPSRDRMYKTLIEKLKSCIDGINRSGFESNGVVGELMLWLLFVGGTVDLGEVNKAWFVVRIFMVAKALELESWSEVKNVLQGYFWVDSLHASAFSSHWDEAAGTRQVS